MGLLWRWCRFQSTLGVILTVVFWTFVCFEFLPKNTTVPTVIVVEPQKAKAKAVILPLELPPEVNARVEVGRDHCGAISCRL